MTRETPWGLTAAILAMAVLLTATASAQEPARAPCPSLPAGASAAEHALCWFDRDQRSDEGCSVADGVRGVCVDQAAAWCANASLDDPHVATACFLAPLRARRFTEAAASMRYVTEATSELQRCGDALASVMLVHVVTNPRGGEVAVDGRSYGSAPLDVRLSNPWWERHVTVTFHADEDESVIDVTADQLAAAFDARACAMGELVVERQRASAPAAHVRARAIAPPARVGLPADSADPLVGGGGGSVVPWIMLGTGGALLVGSLVFNRLAAGQASDLDEACPGDLCPPDYDQRSLSDRFKLYRGLGWGLLGSGLAVAGVGLALLLASPGGDESNVAASAGCDPTGCAAEVTLRFF